MRITELDETLPEWRPVVAGFLAVEHHKEEADAKLQEYHDAILGKADEKGERNDKQSLSAKFVALARECKTEEKFKLAWDTIRQQIKEGFTLDGEQVGHTSVPQALSDAASICRKALRNGVINKGNSTGSLKKLNKEAQAAKKAENPESLNDYLHIITTVYKEAGAVDKEGKQIETPLQAMILAQVKELAASITQANEDALAGAKPKRTTKKATKKATK